MTDIVERLRTRMITVARGDGQYDDIPDEDCWEAADEIERLEAENAALREQVSVLEHQLLQALVEPIRRETP